jgi:hypothetical protein
MENVTAFWAVNVTWQRIALSIICKLQRIEMKIVPEKMELTEGLEDRIEINQFTLKYLSSCVHSIQFIFQINNYNY